MRNYQEYDVWIDGRKFVNNIYDLTDLYPDMEKFGLRSQLNRAAVSIIVNIAEGASRKSERDFGRFLEIARGSAFEVETLLLISADRNLIQIDDSNKLLFEVRSIQKRLFGLLSKVSYI